MTSVRLPLHQADDSDAGGRVWSIGSNSWTESATWNTRPAIDGPHLGAFGPVTAGAWFETDLNETSFVASSPGLVLDGLSQVATPYEGAGQPTLYGP